MKKRNKILALIGLVILGFGMLESCQSSDKLNGYKGVPYSDSVYQSAIQIIPGKIQCEYYDLGGEGITFHDSDSINSG